MPEGARLPMPDFWSMLAREKYGLPEEWRWWHLSRIGDTASFFKDLPRDQVYSMMKGGVYKTLYRSGKRKGQINFKKPEEGTYRELVVTHKELDDYIAKWEQQTGFCGDCYGNGTDHWNRHCKKCDGTGKIRSTATAE